MSKFYQKCYNSADNVWNVCTVNWKGLDPKIIIMFIVRALRRKRWPHLAAYGCDKYVPVPWFKTIHTMRSFRCQHKRSQLGAFCPWAIIVYCYFEFKLRYHRNMKLFSIRLKELFEPIVLRKKSDGFLLFLKAFSWETDLWVTLGVFTVKNAKLGREICI